MKVFASTTFLGTGPTDLTEPLAVLGDLDIDGVELGSTHRWQADLQKQISAHWRGDLLTHNFFPPAKDDLVLNIASTDDEIRRRSIDHMKHCLAFAADIGADLYTIHPGFLAEPTAAIRDAAKRAFDFKFDDDRTPYELAFELMIDALKELVAKADAVGVRLAIETEGSLTSAGVTLMEEPHEYDRLFEIIPEGLHINLNLAHTALAARGHGFNMSAFLAAVRPRIAAVEVSHNDGHGDQHRPLEPGAQVLDWIPHLPDVPLILEFRCATGDDVAASAAILRDQQPPPQGAAHI